MDKKLIIKEDKRPAAEDERRYNAPVADEIATIMVNEPHEERDIILQLWHGYL